MFQLRAEIILRELKYILGLLSCMSGLNHCRAHLSESEDLGSVTKSEGSSCLSFKVEGNAQQ